jgi:hypothetical protein
MNEFESERTTWRESFATNVTIDPYEYMSAI